MNGASLLDTTLYELDKAEIAAMLDMYTDGKFTGALNGVREMK